MVRVFGNIDESKIRNLVNGIKIDGEVLRFEDVVYAGGEGMNHTFYVMIRDGKNKSVKLLWESQEVTVSRIKRVRFGEIFLTKDMPICPGMGCNGPFVEEIVGELKARMRERGYYFYYFLLKIINTLF